MLDVIAPVRLAVAASDPLMKSFWVAPQSPEELLWIYKHADRTVWVQPLPLTPEQKQRVKEKLEYDILDEHRYYAYDHFLDNCTTRLRDIASETPKLRYAQLSIIAVTAYACPAMPISVGAMLTGIIARL